jgi:tight adherence protein B
MLRLTLVPALGCGAALALVPFLYLRVKRNRRLKTMGHQLPYVLDMLRSALQAGHNLLRGLQMASSNSPDPLATELRMIVDHVRVGMRLPIAFELMYRRVPVEELSFLAAAVSVQEETGSSLGEILERVSQSIRNRQRLRDQIQTVTAQSRLSSIIVAALPAVILGAFYLLRPDYVEVLFTNPTGNRLLEGAVVLDVIAFLIMQRIARVDF